MMRKHKLFYIAGAVYLLIVAALLTVSLSLNDGHFVYALDDPYIHMAIAKNLVAHGNFATNNMDFTSASSSPLWVLFISAVYYVFGANVASPFILNLLFQFLSIIIFYYILKQFNVSGLLLCALLGFILFTPLPAILFAGMEHSAHIFFALLFLFFAVKLIVKTEINNNYTLICLLCIAPILTALRYEGMFLVTVVSVLLFLRQKVFYALLIFIFGMLPIVGYGIISISHGWFFLPNTILLKSTPPSFTLSGILRFSFKAFKNITEPHVFLVLIISSFIYVFNYIKQKRFWDEKQILLLIAAFTTIINMAFITYHQNGAFYRYEAYLMALSAAAIAVSFNDFLPDILAFVREKGYALTKSVIFILSLVIISPLVMRIFTVFGIPEAIREYHNQQYQMSQFVSNYIPDVNIAANDMGMLSYYSNGKVVDLWGVANIDIAKEKLNKSYNTNTLLEVTKKENVKLAVLYEHWFDEYGGLPASWKKIGEWTMTDYNFFLGTETVSFYSLNKEDSENLGKKLKDFSQYLPKSVLYKIF